MFSEQYDKMAHDAVASIVRQAALDEWEFKNADLRDFPTGTAHDRDKFLEVAMLLDDLFEWVHFGSLQAPFTPLNKFYRIYLYFFYSFE